MRATNKCSSTNPKVALAKRMEGLGGGIARWGTRWIRKELNYRVGESAHRNNKRLVVDQSEA